LPQTDAENSDCQEQENHRAQEQQPQCAPCKGMDKFRWDGTYECRGDDREQGELGGAAIRFIGEGSVILLELLSLIRTQVRLDDL
jgi:hypothetical protein